MIIGIGQVFTVGLGLVNLNPAALSGLTVPSQFPSHESRSNLLEIRYKAMRISSLFLLLSSVAMGDAFSPFPRAIIIKSTGQNDLTCSTLTKSNFHRRGCTDVCMISEEKPEYKAFSRRAAILISAATAMSPQIAYSETDQKSASNAYWDNLLKEGKISKKAYEVLHFAATERPFTSPLLKEKRNGIFTCAA